MQKEFDEIYRLYAEDVYRFLLKLCRNETLAEDILQDTMLKENMALHHCPQRVPQPLQAQGKQASAA